MKQVDGCNQFEIVVTKWKNNFKVVMKTSCSEHLKNGPTCKDKWCTITNDFKKNYDFMACIENNQDYWEWEFMKELLPIFLGTWDRGCITSQEEILSFSTTQIH
jgi:hypothetical protein